MRDDLRHNSQHLRKRFQEEYDEFFGHQERVISCPVNFWVVGEYANLNGGIGVKQVLPLRVYCGLHASEERRFRINPVVKAFLPSKARFKEISLLPGVTGRIEALLPNICKERFHIDLSGIEAEFFSEAPLFSGLGTSGAMCAALIASIFLHNGQLKQEELTGRPLIDRSTGQFIQKKMEQLFRTAWLLEAIVHHGLSSGTAPFCALVPSQGLPILFALDADYPTDPETEAAKFYEAPYTAVRIADLVQPERAIDWPVSFGLVWSQGKAGLAGDIAKRARSLKRRITTLPKIIRQIGKPPLDRLLDKNKILRSSAADLWKPYTDTLCVLSVDTTTMLLNLFLQREDEPDHIRQFFANVYLYHTLLSYTGFSTSRIDSVVRAIRHLEIPAAAKITGAGGGGDALAFTRWRSFEAIHAFLLDYNRTHGTHLSVDYSYERDGAEENGVLIEPDLRPDRYKCWRNGTSQTVSLANYGEWQKLRDGADLAIDAIDNEIYMHGQPVPATEFKGRGATIKMLAALLDAPLGTPVLVERFTTYSKHDVHALLRLFNASLMQRVRRRLELQVITHEGKPAVALKTLSITAALRSSARVRIAATGVR